MKFNNIKTDEHGQDQFVIIKDLFPQFFFNVDKRLQVRLLFLWL